MKPTASPTSPDPLAPRPPVTVHLSEYMAGAHDCREQVEAMEDADLRRQALHATENCLAYLAQIKRELESTAALESLHVPHAGEWGLPMMDCMMLVGAIERLRHTRVQLRKNLFTFERAAAPARPRASKKGRRQ